MEKIEEFEELYRKYTGESFDFLSKKSIQLIDAPALLFIYDNCNYDKENAIQGFIEFTHQTDKSLNLPLYKFYSFWEKVCFDSNYRNFARLGAEIYVDNFIENPEMAKYEWPDLPLCQKENTAFVDLVSGFGFSDYLKKLNPKTQFFLIDKSMVTCEALRYQAEILHLDNVHVIPKDVKLVNAGDIGMDVEIIRAKNIFRYVPDFMSVISVYKDMICNEGQFVFQEHTKFKSDNPDAYAELYSHLDMCFGNGWTKTKSVSTGNVNIKSFDSVYYKKGVANA
ncbi:hypothetical protein [Fibrobacter sp.]|uniref:hypothetical protein n=1 Tax=Fibrobacter sp. TaxID=35828 RepID=UPI0026328905|nr:hypothetical protein [Fibrobacter sp.]MDD5941524.1 hypothetical protein [Fibrobacter sp.]